MARPTGSGGGAKAAPARQAPARVTTQNVGRRKFAGGPPQSMASRKVAIMKSASNAGALDRANSMKARKIGRNPSPGTPRKVGPSGNGKAASRGGAARIQATAPNRGRRGPSQVKDRSGGLNLNPFDVNNSVSAAGRRVARSMRPGMPNLNPLQNVDVGKAVSGALQDRVIGNPGARIKQVTGQ